MSVGTEYGGTYDDVNLAQMQAQEELTSAFGTSLSSSPALSVCVCERERVCVCVVRTVGRRQSVHLLAYCATYSLIIHDVFSQAPGRIFQYRFHLSGKPVPLAARPNPSAVRLFCSLLLSSFSYPRPLLGKVHQYPALFVGVDLSRARDPYRSAQAVWTYRAIRTQYGERGGSEGNWHDLWLQAIVAKGMSEAGIWFMMGTWRRERHKRPKQSIC